MVSLFSGRHMQVCLKIERPTFSNRMVIVVHPLVPVQPATHIHESRLRQVSGFG